MGVGSGLGAELMAGQESTYGTAVTPDHSYEFDSESLTFNPNWLDSTGLHGGGRFKRASRSIQSTRDATGSFTLDHTTNKMGFWWKNILGSAAVPTQIATTTAYKQVHVPGALTGSSFTLQIGRMQTDAVLKAFTFPGCKIPQATLSLDTGNLLKLAVDVDARDETTATAMAAYAPVATQQSFAFVEATLFKIGGTVTTTSGVTSISGGVTAATVFNSMSLVLGNAMNTARYGIGNAGVKNEPIENALSTVQLTLGGEFTSRAEIYDVMKSGATTAVQVTLVGGAIGVSGSNYTVDLILPACKIKTASPQVGGPDIVGQQVMIEAEDNGTDPVIQTTLISDDVTL